MCLFSLIYFSALPLLLSLVFLDITPFHFKTEGKKGLRLIFFDVTNQKIDKIYYIEQTNRRALDQIAFSGKTFKINFYGNIIYHQPDSSLHILSFADPGLEKVTCQPFSKGQELARVAHLIRSTTPYGKAFPLFWKKGNFTEERTLTTISFDRQTNHQERGFLGERVTDLTFLYLGFKKYKGQNRAGQGLDGIFFDPEEKILILTESKCREESKTALKYMQDDLSETKIVNRLQEITDKNTYQKVQAFITHHIRAVFKCVQRLKPSGFIESALSPLDILMYLKTAYPQMQKAPFHLKKIFLNETLHMLGLTLSDPLLGANQKVSHE